MIRLTAVFELEGGAPRALTFESNARFIVLGRDATADFQLPLSTVSRQHARISESDGVYLIEDLGSTHGTRCNDSPLIAGDKRVLRDGDIIELTRAKITCSIEAAKVASADPQEGSVAVAARAVQGILGRLGEPRQADPYLRAVAGSVEGARYTLKAGSHEWTLGRSPECECVIEDVNVSRRHAVVRKDWTGFIIEDLGSKNGVTLNRRRLHGSRPLKHEDEIQIGPIKLIFIDPNADVMAALKAVPGFEVPEPPPEPDEPKEANRPAEDASAPTPEPEPQDEVPAAPAADEEPDALSDLDPSLLEPAPKKQAQLDYALLGGAVLVALLCGLGLFLVL